MALAYTQNCLPVNNELRHQAWRLICEHFPRRANATLRTEIFNAEFDSERDTNDCRKLIDTIGFSSPELARRKLAEIHELAVQARGGEAE